MDETNMEQKPERDYSLTIFLSLAAVFFIASAIYNPGVFFSILFGGAILVLAFIGLVWLIHKINN